MPPSKVGRQRSLIVVGAVAVVAIIAMMSVFAITVYNVSQSDDVASPGATGPGLAVTTPAGQASQSSQPSQTTSQPLPPSPRSGLTIGLQIP